MEHRQPAQPQARDDRPQARRPGGVESLRIPVPSQVSEYYRMIGRGEHIQGLVLGRTALASIRSSFNDGGSAGMLQRYNPKAYNQLVDAAQKLESLKMAQSQSSRVSVTGGGGYNSHSIAPEYRPRFSGKLNAKVLYPAIARAETGREPNPQIRTRCAVPGRKVSTAYGEVQMTKTLVEECLASGAYPSHLIPYVQRFLVQAQRMQAAGESVGGRYGRGAPGDLSGPGDLASYRLLGLHTIDREMSAVVAANPRASMDVLLARFIDRWRGRRDIPYARVVKGTADMLASRSLPDAGRRA